MKGSEEQGWKLEECLEAITIVQVRNDDGCNQCSSRRSGNELSDPGSILKEELTKFADVLVAQLEIRQGLSFQDFWLEHLEGRQPTTFCMCEGDGGEVGKSKSGLGHRVEIHQSEDVKPAVGPTDLEYRGEVWARDINLGVIRI